LTAGPSGLDLDVLPSSRPGHRPAMLVLPGGGYVGHASHESEPVAAWLAGLGIHAVVLRYRVAPHQHPAPLEDARAALDWIRDGSHGLELDRERVGVLGFSAGGHLAASLANEPRPPDLSVLGYPVISLVDEPHQGSVDALLGHGADAGRRAAHSADRRVHAGTPPAFVWHTADDAAVPVGHSLRYTAALAAVAVPVELHVFPRGRHGLGLAAELPDVARWTGLCERWLESHGWTGATGTTRRPA
jgi:acetyl esterase/lipase